MGKNLVILLIHLLILILGCSLASATPTAPTAKMVCGVVTSVVAEFFKWLVSLKSEMEPAFSRVKFESGYNVETIFDGNKLGIEPYSVEVSPAGAVFILDSENSNIYKITTPHSLYSRPMLVIGSPEGCSGHVDGKLRGARMNHPKGLAMDDSGNMYVADTMNMAIRKITNTGIYPGVVTIAGGKRFQGERHVDKPNEEDVKLSNDFDVVYVRSSCSLLVIDRGNRAIRQIQLHKHDCSSQYDSNLHLGSALLFAACFFGYMLALLKDRVSAISSPNCLNNYALITGRLLVNIGSSVVKMLLGFRKKPNLHYSHKHSNSWSMKEYYALDYEDDLPFLDPKYPPPRTLQHFRQSQPDNSGGQSGDFHKHQQVHHHQNKKQSSNPQTCTEQTCETNEVVFGAVQEQDGCRESMVIKNVDYSDPAYNHYNIRSRYSCNMSSFYGY